MKHLMYLLLPLSVFLATGAQASLQLKVVCDNTVGGYLIHGNFDSATPHFSTKFMRNPDRIFLSKDSVCGLPIDFSKSCKAEVKTYQEDIGYFFECINGTKGESVFSVDSLTFRCTGTDVPEDSKLVFIDGCKLQ